MYETVAQSRTCTSSSRNNENKDTNTGSSIVALYAAFCAALQPMRISRLRPSE